ncbi:MAG: cation diffusion facilitator family transporter [Granulosicoccaceae bacterium]|jgi:cation diffusion facilitator family transporter
MAGDSRKVIYAALVGNTLISATKFLAAAITGSSAMLSEGIHSVVDTGNQLLLLHGLKQARKPADEDFPFGHGKEVYFWSFVVAILIFALGGGISIYEGVKHLQHPTTIANPLINYIVLALAIIFEGGAWYFAFTEFRKLKDGRGYIEAVQRAKDPSMFVVLFEDSAAILGLLVALAGVLLTDITGNGMFDGAASVTIGLILLGTAIWLAYETKGLLIGESASKGVVSGIRGIVAAHAHVGKINEVLTMHMGPDYILATVSADFVDSVSSAEVEATVAALKREVAQQYPQVKKVFIEANANKQK